MKDKIIYVTISTSIRKRSKRTGKVFNRSCGNDRRFQMSRKDYTKLLRKLNKIQFNSNMSYTTFHCYNTHYIDLLFWKI